MSILIGVCILVAALCAWAIIHGGSKLDPLPQFDPEAPTLRDEILESMAREAGPQSCEFWRNPAESPFTLRPNWDEAPEDATHCAQDADGELRWHFGRPRHAGHFLWWDDPNYAARTHAKGPANPNWKQAIEQRPVKQGTYDVIEPPTPEQIAASATHVWHAQQAAPERDNCDLISREELERLRLYAKAYDKLLDEHSALVHASIQHCKAPGSVPKFKTLAKLAGVTL